jgi:WD40 repeat protein
LWDLAVSKEKAFLAGHKGSVLSVAFSPDGKLIASGSGEQAPSGIPTTGEVKVWDASTGKEIVPVKGKERDEMRPVYSVAFSPDSKMVASADIFGNVLLWEAQTGKRSRALQAFRPGIREKDVNSAISVTFSPDGTTLAGATVQGIKLWDVKTGKEAGPVGGPSATVMWAVAFRPDGKVLASAGSKRVVGQINRLEGDETLSLWELVSPQKADR